jgi:hypothetical protein
MDWDDLDYDIDEPLLPEEEYNALATTALRQLLERELAVVPIEVQARLAEAPWGDLPHGINPHHLTKARQRLLGAGLIEAVEQATRGGLVVPVLALTAPEYRRTTFKRRAARKRLHYARWRSWGSGSGGRPNMIGRAGEAVTYATLRAAAARSGYLLVQPDGGEIEHLFNRRIPGGSLDNAAHLTLLDRFGVPTHTVTVLIEVKNIREWIYPHAKQLYTLLDKAAQIQIAHPARGFVPLLVCRRVHYTTFRMARDLGFFVAENRAQFVLPRAEVVPEQFEQVRQVLGLRDLQRSDGVHPPLLRRLNNAVLQVADRTAERFAQTAPALAVVYQLMRHHSTPQTMQQIRDVARTFPWYEGGW